MKEQGSRSNEVPLSSPGQSSSSKKRPKSSTSKTDSNPLTEKAIDNFTKEFELMDSELK
ncbi:hypothetical protein BDC45DRAFT_567411 [Circinella umbellata]|nr:hypothetical protein BDC45DRAFT_567411 [Circinella umbellata]